MTAAPQWVPVQVRIHPVVTPTRCVRSGPPHVVRRRERIHRKVCQPRCTPGCLGGDRGTTSQGRDKGMVVLRHRPTRSPGAGGWIVVMVSVASPADEPRRVGSAQALV